MAMGACQKEESECVTCTTDKYDNMFNNISRPCHPDPVELQKIIDRKEADGWDCGKI